MAGSDANELLLSDGCDHGVHIFCLCPILPRVLAGEWFCPSSTTTTTSSASAKFAAAVHYWSSVDPGRGRLCALHGSPQEVLVSSYRYAGEHVDDELARAEAAKLHGAVVVKKEVLHGDVVRIVSSRSKPQLKATFEHYKQEHGKAIDEVLDGNHNDKLLAMLKAAVWCLTSPGKHFAEVIQYGCN